MKSELLAKFRILIGAWRSPAAHCNGVAGVASSNLAAPTEYNSGEMEQWRIMYRRCLGVVLQSDEDRVASQNVL